MINYEIVIGVEVHAQLQTKKKIFSPSINNTDSKPNTNVHPIDLGLPGALPRFNKEVLDKSLNVAKALGMTVTKEMHWDRKNYFYHDNPKGYQITQKDTPIGREGRIILDSGKVIEIDFMHMEEDTAKSFHNESETLLDFNRCGIPLVEIVTKPVISSKEEAKEYLEKLRQILLYIEASDCKMEDGSLRIDLNVSVRPYGQKELNPKVEIKNLNSFTNLLKAVDLEVMEQIKAYNSSLEVKETTKRFDESTKTLKIMRVKDGQVDYRYFPEPDLPKIILSDEYIKDATANLPILPGQIKEKLEELDLNSKDIVNLMSNIDMCKFYLELINLGLDSKASMNYMIVNVAGVMNKETLKFTELVMQTEDFIELEKYLKSGEISTNHVKKIIPLMITSEKTTAQIIEDLGIKQITDENVIKTMVLEVLTANEQSIIDFQNGKDRAIGFLVGQIIKKSKGQANPTIVNKVLLSELERLKND